MWTGCGNSAREYCGNSPPTGCSFLNLPPASQLSRALRISSCCLCWGLLACCCQHHPFAPSSQLVLRRALGPSPLTLGPAIFDVDAVAQMKHLSVSGGGGTKGGDEGLFCRLVGLQMFPPPPAFSLLYPSLLPPPPVQVLVLNSGFNSITGLPSLPDTVKTLVISCPGNPQSSFLHLPPW